MQRGGSPCAFDRVLCTQLGAAAAQAILDEDYGCMIGMVNGRTERIPLEEVAGKLKTVDPDCQLIQEGKTDWYLFWRLIDKRRSRICHTRLYIGNTGLLSLKK